MVYYVEEAETFSLTGGTAAYTMGSGGDFDTVRPVKILGAYVRSGNTDYPLDIVDAARYREITQKSWGGTPAQLWYNPVYPLGEIKLYPTPTGDSIYLDSMKPLSEPAALATSTSFPEGYNRMLRFNLAIDLAPEYGIPISPALAILAEQSKDAIRKLNASLQVEETKLDILKLTSGYRTRFNIEAG